MHELFRDGIDEPVAYSNHQGLVGDPVTDARCSQSSNTWLPLKIHGSSRSGAIHGGIGPIHGPSQQIYMVQSF